MKPELVPSAGVTALAWLALDIETDRAGAVTAVSLAGGGGPGEVLFVGPPVASSTVTSVASERALLTMLGERLRARDPDVVTGWNVVDFDLQVLAARHAAHVGREAGARREGACPRAAPARVPGRRVRRLLAGGEAEVTGAAQAPEREASIVGSVST